jgi:hypothetical protein
VSTATAGSAPFPLPIGGGFRRIDVTEESVMAAATRPVTVDRVVA